MSTEKKSRLLPFLLCIATGVFSVSLLLKSIDSLGETISHERDWPKVEAVVVGFDAQTIPRKKGTYFAPIFSYTTLEGKPVRSKSNFSASPPACKVNDKTELHYNPANPTEIMETGFSGKYMLSLVSLLFGLAIGAVSIGTYFISLRKK